MPRTTTLALALGLLGSLADAVLAAEVVAIVSSESSITELSEGQIADVFLGRISRLPDGQKVVPLDHPEGSPTRDAFYEHFTGKSPAQVKAHWSKIIFTGRGRPPAEVADGEEARKRVREDPLAIAYVDRKLVDDSVRVVSPQPPR